MRDVEIRCTGLEAAVLHNNEIIARQEQEIVRGTFEPDETLLKSHLGQAATNTISPIGSAGLQRRSGPLGSSVALDRVVLSINTLSHNKID